METPRPNTLPLFPLGNVLVPGGEMGLHIFERRYRDLMRDHLGRDPIFGVVLTESGSEVGDEPSTHAVGTAATLVSGSELPDGRWGIVVRGGDRFRVVSSDWGRGYLTAEVEWLRRPAAGEADPARARRLAELLVRFATVVGHGAGAPEATEELRASLLSGLGDDEEALGWAATAGLPLDTWDRQRVLAIEGLEERTAAVARLLERETEMARLAGPLTGHVTTPGGFLPN